VSIPSIMLNDGSVIPQLGYGLFQIENENAARATIQAVQTGYRLLDTAMIYRNEEGVGTGIRQAIEQGLVARSDLFITTKLWNGDQGYDSTHKAFETSLALLGVDVIDLYLIHWPVPARNLYVESWKACVELQKQGRVRSIGVCNFRIQDLTRIMEATGVIPVLNQIELHPAFQQSELRAFHQRHQIATQAWSPLARGASDLLNNKILTEMASRYQRTVAQIILRWHIESGNIVIPKTQNQDRMRQNIALFDFSLKSADLDLIAALDCREGRIGPDPALFE